MASVVWLKAFCHIITSLLTTVENNLELNSEIFLSFHSIIHLHVDQTEMSIFPHDYFEEFCKGIVMLQVNLFLWSFCFQPRSICFNLQ